MSSLKRLMRSALESCVKTVEDGGEVLPHFIADTERGERLAIFTPWGCEQDKKQALLFVRACFQHKRVTSYCLVSEVWVAELESGETLDGLPEHHPNRKERISVLGVNRGGVQVLWSDIKRAGGEITCSPETFDESGDAMRFSGRMAELLPPPDAPPLPPALAAEIERMLCGNVA